MPKDMHREAESLASKAALERRSGRIDEALVLYGRAADAECAALEALSSDKSRTHSVLSLSAASLLYKAERFDESERLIFKSLAEATLEEWADKQLRELLQVVSDERALCVVSGRRYSGDSITLALRGDSIGSGTGPLDIVLHTAGAFRKLLLRFAEWKGDYPLRTYGSVPKALLGLVQARVCEPAPGSYRLEVRLTEPRQRELFEERGVEPRVVSDAMFDFLTRLTEGTAADIEAFIPQPDYRKALLQLTRGLTPSGKRLNEVSIYRRRDSRTQSVHLKENVSPRIRRALPKPELPKTKRGELRGTLRALHLDENWLELTTPAGDHVKCATVHDMLDDMVGPMVNHEVIVRGPYETKYGKTRLLAEDVEQVEED